VRLFTAIPLPDFHLEKIVSLTQNIEKIRWTTPENLHLTVKFLGEIPLPKINLLIEGFSSLIIAPPIITIKGCGVFPGGKKPKIIYLGVEKNAPLVKLEKNISAIARKKDLKLEKRTYTPHITLGRLRHIVPVGLGDFLSQLADFSLPAYTAPHFLLLSSVLRAQGAVYELIESFSFKKTRK